MSPTPPPARRVADALRIHVDARRGSAEQFGTDRATLDESHRLALLHPQYDGFIVLYVTALTDLDDIRVVPDDTLERFLTPHHLIGPLHRDQVRPVDLELHPVQIGGAPVSGLIHVVDGSGAAVCPAMRCTLATDPALECTLAGALDGPWGDPAEFEEVVREFGDGAGDAKAMAHRIERIEAGRDDPGWPRRRRLWGRS